MLHSIVFLAAMMMACHGFVVVPTSSTSSTIDTTTRLNFFGGPKDDGTPGDYVCKDCGYIFTKGPEAWAKLPSSYGCPPCGAGKNRFKKVPKGTGPKKVEVKKSWF